MNANLKKYIKSLFDSKQKIIFWILVTFLIASIVIGITLTAIGASDYSHFVQQWKNAFASNNNNPTNLQDITKFIYGVFFLVISLLTLIASLLYGNSVFNKKMIEEK